MSTTPGDSTWADAGLVPPDSSQVQDPGRTTVPVPPEDQPRAPRPLLRDEARLDRRVAEGDAVDGYEPGDPRPDRADAAAERDVTEDYTPADPRPDLRDEAPEPDVVEQLQDVPTDDEDAYP